MHLKALLCLFVTLWLVSGQGMKLPLYVGVGFDIFKGNPMANMVDPGYRVNIYDFTYKKMVKTDDDKYIIPDEVDQRRVSSCSFSTDVTTYRGTESYQNDLKKKVEINGGYDGGIFQASFSVSTEWTTVKNQTIDHSMSITHATAECQAYSIAMSLFNHPKFSQNFVDGAIQSYKKSNWEEFIKQFGTHYVYDVTMGGRASQEITYEYRSVQTMKSVGVDINVAARAKYAKFFGDASYNYSKQETEINYAEKYSNSTKELYIGGVPPRDGNVLTWAAQVQNNPMPIRYKLEELSEKFHQIKAEHPAKAVLFDAAKAVTQFKAALIKYCTSINCSKAIIDKLEPPPAKVFQTWTPQYCSRSTDIAYDQNPVKDSTTMQATKFIVHSGTVIDNLQIMLGDGVKTKYTAAVGGIHGNLAEWSVPEGEHVTQVEIRCATYLNALTFITNTGKKSPFYGGYGGDYYLLNIPEDYRIIGFYGKVSYNEMLSIGFNIAKTIYPDALSVPQLTVG